MYVFLDMKGRQNENHRNSTSFQPLLSTGCHDMLQTQVDLQAPKKRCQGPQKELGGVRLFFFPSLTARKSHELTARNAGTRALQPFRYQFFKILNGSVANLRQTALATQLLGIGPAWPSLNVWQCFRHEGAFFHSILSS